MAEGVSDKASAVALVKTIGRRLSSRDWTSVVKGGPARLRLVWRRVQSSEARQSWLDRVPLHLFLLTVVLPSCIYFLYMALLQSPGHVAEARIALRGAADPKASITDAASIISRITSAGGSRVSIQDAYIVLNFIKSSAIVGDLGGHAYLDKYYARSDIDYFSRLSKNASIEDLTDYWINRVAVSIDTVSGILTIRVMAFQPAEAAAIAQDVIRVCEGLVNRVSVSSRQDAVVRTEAEVHTAGDRLARMREALLQFRNANALIDPASTAQRIAEQIGVLTLEKINLETALETLSGSINANAPTQRIQRSRLATIDHQLEELRGKLVSREYSGTLSSKLGEYERLKLNEQFAEKIYTISQASYYKARQELDKQQIYLVTLVPPIMPQEATYPKIFGGTLILFSFTFVIWAMIALLVAGIEDHRV